MPAYKNLSKRPVAPRLNQPVEFGNLILDPSVAALGAGIAALFGLVVWWLVRKRQKRIWLPTIRIMELESRLLPRLLLRPPPFIPFLCFLIASLVLLGFSTRPRTQVFTPFEPNQTRIHVFVDLSASVAAHLTIDEYAQKVAALYTSLKESGRVTLSLSDAPDVLEPETPQALQQTIKEKGFHRAGLRLGSSLKMLIESLGEVDRLFIVSDRDQHTWNGFNWRYLLDDMDVLFYDVAGAGQEPQNLFVNDARFLSTPAAPTMDWDVEIARRGPGPESEGKLNVVYRNTVIATFPWKLGAEKQRLTVRATWPNSAVDELSKAATEDEPLIFKLEVDKGGDALALDDEYRTELLGLRQDVLLVSETAGERTLEDPSNQLTIALEVLGFRMQRHDFVRQPGPDPDNFPFWVLVGGMGSGVDRFCPKSIQVARTAAKAKGKQGAKDGRRHPLPRIWLAPHALDASYKELCQCYSRLLLTKAGEGSPEYCENIDVRSQWLGLLPSLGAKQIGGEIGDASGSLAWLGKDQASGLEVVAFTVPLAPSVQTGINHAQLPLLVKELLTWQSILEPRGGAAASTWPRLDDVAESLWRPPPGTSTMKEPPPPAELARMRVTNVPLGESLMVEVDEATLPPRWTSQMDWSDKQLPAKKDREDPLPWLKLAAILVIGATAFEGLWTIAARVLSLIGKRPEAAVLLVAAGLAGAFGSFAGDASAKVEFNVLSYAEGPMTFQTLAREVSHRTSIELEVKPSGFSQLAPEALQDPWLWAHDVSAITTASGQLKTELAIWLKRGGFLVIEQQLSDEKLKKLTENLARGEAAVWLPLPPDHEIMRSFYLLDALPSCGSEIWRGFQYDGRLAILTVPYGFLSTLKDRGQPAACANPPDQERSVRVFVNLIMVALATDYKKDQIHLPEILKRLR